MKMQLKKQWFIKILATSLLILICAALARFNQNDSALSLDEAEYALAAQKGFIANYLDAEQTRLERHFHGPIIAYMIRASVLVLGPSEKAIRLPSRLLGVLTCVLLFWGSIWVFKNGYWIGAISGFLLAIMPVHAHVSGVANMHSLATFLILSSFFLTYKCIVSEKPVFLYLQAIILGILFCTIEYGFILSLIVLSCLVMSKNQHFYFENYRIRISKSFIWALLILAATIFIFWFAGIAKLHLLKNLVYYLKYSKQGHPIQFRGELTYHVPWWAYFYWFSKLAPVWLFLSLGGLIYLAFKLIITKAKVKYRIVTIFLTILLISLFRQHIMSARYSVYVVPFLSLVAAMLLDGIKAKWPRPGLIIIMIALVSVLLANYKHILPGVQGDPGYPEAAKYLRDHAAPNDRILTWYQPIVRFYLPEYKEIYNYNSGGASESLLAELKVHRFRYVIFYINQVRRWPEDEGFIFVKNNYQLKQTIFFENEPVLWIYEKPYGDLSAGPS